MKITVVKRENIPKMCLFSVSQVETYPFLFVKKVGNARNWRLRNDKVMNYSPIPDISNFFDK